jgi:hypothetical protein
LVLPANTLDGIIAGRRSKQVEPATKGEIQMTTTNNAPAKKAASKPVAKKPAPAKAASTKLRWQKDDGGGQTAVAANGTTYAIVADGDKFTATATTAAGKVTVLAEKVGGTAAYYKCVKHHAETQEVASTAPRAAAPQRRESLADSTPRTTRQRAG